MCPREALYGLAKVDGLVAGLLPDVNSMHEMVFVKRTIIRRWYGWELRWKSAFIPARERCSEQLKGS